MKNWPDCEPAVLSRRYSIRVFAPRRTPTLGLLALILMAWITLRPALGASLAGSTSHVQGPPSQALSTKELVAACAPSVVLIRAEDANGYPLALGSGFVVGKGLIATNLHVLVGATTASVKLAGPKADWMVAQGVAGFDPEADLAILAAKGIDAPSLQLRQDDKAAVGDPVLVIGNPLGLEGTVSQGIVSGLRDSGTEHLLQISSPISPGSSGGPVLDDHGKVIGVAVSTLREGQNLNFAVPVAALRTLVGHIAEPQKLSTLPSSANNAVAQPRSKELEKAFTCHSLLKKEQGEFSFSVVNNLPSTVYTVRFVAVFYSKEKLPLGYCMTEYPKAVDIWIAVDHERDMAYSGDPNSWPDHDAVFAKLEMFLTGRLEGSSIPTHRAVRVTSRVPSPDILELADSYELRVLDYSDSNPGTRYMPWLFNNIMK